MIDPSYAVQKALVATIVGASAVQSAADGNAGVRVYDNVPDNAVFPYVTLDHDQVLGNGEECDDGPEVHVTLSVWSRDPESPGKAEAKRITAALALALDAAIPIAGYRVVTHQIDSVQHMTDRDGLTAHSVIMLTYAVVPG